MENFFKAEFENPFFKFKKIEPNLSPKKIDEEESEKFLKSITKKNKKSVETFSRNMSDSYQSSPLFIDSDSNPVTRYAHHLYAHHNS